MEKYNFTAEEIRKALEYDFDELERMELEECHNMRPCFHGVEFSCWKDDVGDNGYFRIWRNGITTLFEYTDIFESKDTPEDYQVVADYLNNFLYIYNT